MPRVWTCKTSNRPVLSGTPMVISRSNRPGRRSAGSRASGMLVAPMTMTCPRSSSPSMSVSSCDTTLRSTCCSPLSAVRLGAIASISSRKMMLGPARACSKTPQMRFAFAVELVHDLRAAETEELRVGLIGDGPGDECLAASRWAVQEDAFRRLDAESFENFRIAQRQLDHLADGTELALQPADILVGDPLWQYLDAAAAAADLDRSGRLDDHRPLGPGLQNGEVLTASAHQRRADTIALDQYQALEETADIVIFIFFAGVTRRGERGQSDLLGGTVVGALQPQPFAQRGAGI